jgi:hypothetical protein
MITFKNILEEKYKTKSRVKQLDENKLLNILKKDCKDFVKHIKKHGDGVLKHLNLIFRSSNTNGNFGIIDPKNFNRKSIDANNIEDYRNSYVRVISNSKYWKNYPKYEKSIIGIYNNSFSDYGRKVFVIIPFDGAKIVVCNNSMFPFSFKNIPHKNAHFYDNFFKIGINKFTKNNVNIVLKGRGTKNMNFDEYEINVLKDFFKSKFKTLYDYIEYQLRPEVNIYNVVNSKTVYNSDYNNKQVFTDSKCLLINWTIFDEDLINKIQNLEIK